MKIKRKNKRRKTKLKNLLKEILLLLMLAGLLTMFAAMAGVTPSPSGKTIIYNFTAMYVALAFASVTFISRMVHKRTGAWWAKFLVNATIWGTMVGVMAFNWATAGMTNWWIGGPLIVTYLLSVLLPVINIKMAERLHDEMFAPTSCLGKVIIFSILAIGPAAGSFGVFLSGLARRTQGINMYMLIGVFLCVFFSWGTTTMVYQVWEERPWKDKE